MKAKVESEEVQAVRTTCEHCYYQCGLLAYVKKGRVVRIKGDPEHPQYEGRVCPKGGAHLGEMYSPERLLYPLKRVGAEWRRVSWEEALEEIAERLGEIKRKYGALAISAASDGGGRQVLNTLLVRAIGSPNVYVNHAICSGGARVGDFATYGEWLTGDLAPDYANSKCILLVGTNLAWHGPPFWHKVKEALKLGAKLITIDPRATETTAKSDIWLRPHPWTDAALGLGIANVIIEERLYDADFVSKWGYGFDKFVERAREYPLSRVEHLTGVPKDKIIQAARLFAMTKPACMHIRSGLVGQPQATQAVRAMNLLLALTGNLDIPGGNRFIIGFRRRKGIIMASGIHESREFRLPREIEEMTIGAKDFPLCAGPDSLFAAAHGSLLFKAMLTNKPYPLRAMLVAGSNLVINHPEARTVREALKSLDLLVVLERSMNPTAQLAHYVLPVSDYLERDEVSELYSDIISIRQKVVEPLGECRDDREIALSLAQILHKKGLLDYPNLSPWRDMEEFDNYRVKNLGVSVEEVKRRGIIKLEYEYEQYKRLGRFPTPTGKVEFYSTLLEKYGFDPLPGYNEIRPWSPEITKEFPLLLFAGVRHWAYKHSENRTNAWLKKVLPAPVVEVNPATAASLGLKEGDWVEIWTPYGGPVKQRVVYVPETHPACIATQDGWWFPDRAEGGWTDSNVNLLTTMELNTIDPISGAYLLKGIPCRLARVK